MLDTFTNKSFTQVLKCLSILTVKLFVEQIIKNRWSKPNTKTFILSIRIRENN